MVWTLHGPRHLHLGVTITSSFLALWLSFKPQFPCWKAKGTGHHCFESLEWNGSIRFYEHVGSKCLHWFKNRISLEEVPVTQYAVAAQASILHTLPWREHISHFERLPFLVKPCVASFHLHGTCYTVTCSSKLRAQSPNTCSVFFLSFPKEVGSRSATPRCRWEAIFQSGWACWQVASNF